MTELKDELLVAYVDGQLAKDQSTAIERVLEEDQVAAQRVLALKAAHTHLESAFDAMMAGNPSPPPVTSSEIIAEPAIPRRRRTVGSILRRSIAFAWDGSGCLIGGAAAGYILYDQIAAEPYQTVIVMPPEPTKPVEATTAPQSAVSKQAPSSWEDDVARAQTLLSRDTFSVSLLGEGNADLVGFKIANVFGKEFKIPDLSALDLVFQRAQMLQRDGVPIAQVAYLPETGVPLALYAKASTDVSQPIRIREVDGMSLAAWTHGGLSMLLAGQLSDDQLRAVAHAINEQLTGASPVTGDTGVPTSPVIQDTAAELREHAVQSPEE